VVGVVVPCLAWWSRPRENSLLVEFDAEALRVEGRTVCSVVANPKDGYPDFPETAYARGAFDIVPLRSAIAPWSLDGARPLRLSIPDAFLFATWRPLLITARDAGFDSALVDGSTEGAYPIHFAHGDAQDSSAADTADAMGACIFLRPDSIVARRSCDWLYSSSDGPQAAGDSSLDRILLDNEIRERIAVVPTRGAPRQIAAFVDSLEAFLDDGSWLQLEVRPTVTCRDFLGFNHDLDSVSLSRGRVPPERRFDDYFLAFRMRSPTPQAQPRRASSPHPRKPEHRPLVLEMGAEEP